ncbi:MAG: hypothetical protein M0P31_14200 [Solirubrobacteraceae bacterium]|nr:hypothetical protein [Solirubrobacteraceae bacterium]
MARRLATAPAPVVGGVIGLMVLVVLHVVRGVEYWNFSEGVYAFTARLLLDGHDVYGDVVAAQPPVMLLAGAGILAVSDTIEGLRAGVALLQLAGGVLAALTAARLGASRAWVVATPALAMLLPWAVHEHGALTPEPIGLPLLLGAGLAAARPGHAARVAGVLLAVAAFTKVTFLLPAVAVTLVARDRAVVARWLVGALVVQAALWTALFGGGMWGDAVVAQSESAIRSVRYMVEVLSQSLWSLLGLLGGVAWLLCAWRRERRSSTPAVDADQRRVSVTLAIAMLLTSATMLKDGTGLNVLVPVETALLPLAVAGFALAWRTASRPAVRVVVVTLALLGPAQSMALLAGPEDPVGFLRPFSGTAWARLLSSDEVRAQATIARACPPGAPYSGQPFVAFVAERPMPADQPDLFITARAEHHRDVYARMLAVAPRCP